MPSVSCPKCGTRLRVDDDLDDDDRIECTRCGKRFRPPQEEEEPVHRGKKVQKAGPLASLGGCLVLFALCGGGIYSCDSYFERARADVAAADRLYAEGKRAEAVAKYKDRFSHVPELQRTEVIKRIVDHEATAGDPAAARQYVEKGLDGKLKVEYETPAARDLLARVQQERAAAEARRQAAVAEREAAERQAEAKRKADREARERTEKDAEQKAERFGRSYEAYRYTQGLVKAKLQPYDAKFSLVPDHKQNADGSWTTLGAVTTPNEFGGKNKYVYKSTVRKRADGQWEDVETVLGIDPN